MPVELTTVADDEAVFHDGDQVDTYSGLEPHTEYTLRDTRFRTLPRPGERLATIATVNDVHFGETVCGLVEGSDVGPVLRVEEGEPPYPETMNRAAVAEIAAADPDLVVVKGDLTAAGEDHEYAAFLDCYGAFGDRLRFVRGNHDAYHRQSTIGADPTQEVTLPGVVVAVLDTTIERAATGSLADDQIEWLDELGARADRPVLVFGHHHVWSPDSRTRPDEYYGIHPDASEKLVEVFVRRPALVGYFAGHTHRNRVRKIRATGDVPWVEVASPKEFPGTWAEYRVHEGGILQVHRRINATEALAWSEKTRAMYNGTYADYAFGSLADRCFLIPPRS